AGEIMRLPTLAETLCNIAEGGSNYIYKGDFAHALCAHVQNYGGWLEVDDLSEFEPEWNAPIFADYHGHRLYECPPNGQGLAAIMAVRIAEGFNLSEMSQVDRTHTMIECMRLGFTEALAWVGDPLYEEIPFAQLFDDDYIESRRQMIKQDQAINHIQSGIVRIGEDTTYLSVVDAEGNACSFINSLFYGGGSGLVVPGTGVLLQNRAASFSLDPMHANALKGGKRPYHTIIPAMITKGNDLYASLGVMGGYMQPQGHLQMMVNLIDLGFNPQQALDMPRFCLSVLGGGLGAEDPGGQLALEEGFDSKDIAELEARGHQISQISGHKRIKFGGGQIILRDLESGVLTAGSEPRKDGCALGY
ncbi:MAG: gamma-glutamyltransferase, partial [Anaerolineaceae bacterium]|nr:gamma-glutamyltransferase [Anaerolineaceae bacterium]